MPDFKPEAPLASQPEPPSFETGSIEPWMRGPIPDVDPLLAPVLYSFQQAREDLVHWTEGLTGEQLWAADLEASAHATPITYMGKKTGKQFVVIAAGGGGFFMGKVSDALEAFALPD